MFDVSRFKRYRSPSDLHVLVVLIAKRLPFSRRVKYHTFADSSVAPDQPAHPCSLTGELHYPLICKIGLNLSMDGLALMSYCAYAQAELELHCSHMACDKYVSKGG